MKYIRPVYWILPLLFIFSAVGAHGQRVCKVRKGKSPSGPASSSVFIEITDETQGKVVTFRKEYKLDHIPVAQRDQYVDDLIDELTGFSDKQESFFVTNPKRPAVGNPKRK
jgi:hypothetical protein